ncbi:MAG: nitronate monooxygenase [Acidobacteria bacterium]|nr:nitronate monooxygenase [Acidobacteriota bacterium]
MNTNELARRLEIDLPVIQGPFGTGFSTPQLVAAVSNAGGLGSFGAYHLPPEEILRTAAEIRRQTGRPFNLNLWVSNRDAGADTADGEDLAGMQRLLAPFYQELGIEPAPVPVRSIPDFDDQVQAVIEARPRVFSFVFGIPSQDVIRECRKRDILLAGAATTPDEARALEEAGVDIVVASGFEAGGHRPSFLKPAEDSLVGTLALVPAVAGAVRIPVVAAGGIADGPAVKAAEALGASGVQVGTAFLACEESGAPELHRRALFHTAGAATVLSRTYTGRLARGIRNRIHDQLHSHSLLPFPVQSWVVGTLREAAIRQGRADLISLWSGQGAGRLKHSREADVMTSLLA